MLLHLETSCHSGVATIQILELVAKSAIGKCIFLMTYKPLYLVFTCASSFEDRPTVERLTIEILSSVAKWAISKFNTSITYKSHSLVFACASSFGDRATIAHSCHRDARISSQVSHLPA